MLSQRSLYQSGYGPWVLSSSKSYKTKHDAPSHFDIDFKGPMSLFSHFEHSSAVFFFFFFITVPETRVEPMFSIYLVVSSSTYHSVLQEQTLNKCCQLTRQNGISHPMAYDFLKEVLSPSHPT